MSAVYEAVPTRLSPAWGKDGHFHVDRDLLLGLFSSQIDTAGKEGPATGAWALALDVWAATELRRAGIEPDCVWPRESLPRTVPWDLRRARSRLKLSSGTTERAAQEKVLDELEQIAGSSQTNVLGGYFGKEIDVVMANWDRGLELAISTKAMTGSFGKNITNRFEEASGDLLNIRRRYPLATFGYLYLVTSNVFDQPHGWERIKDMLRKLGTIAESGQQPYDATGLIVLDLSGSTPSLLESEVPEDLAPDRFFERMMRTLFARSPVSEHADARAQFQRHQDDP